MPTVNTKLKIKTRFQAQLVNEFSKLLSLSVDNTTVLSRVVTHFSQKQVKTFVFPYFDDNVLFILGIQLLSLSPSTDKADMNVNNRSVWVLNVLFDFCDSKGEVFDG